MNTGIHKIWFHITEKGSIYFITKNIEITSVYLITPNLKKPIKRGKIKKAIKEKNFVLFAFYVWVEDWNYYKELKI